VTLLNHICQLRNHSTLTSTTTTKYLHVCPPHYKKRRKPLSATTSDYGDDRARDANAFRAIGIFFFHSILFTNTNLPLPTAHDSRTRNSNRSTQHGARGTQPPHNDSDRDLRHSDRDSLETRLRLEPQVFFFIFLRIR
jgi:hypothetical protein